MDIKYRKLIELGAGEFEHIKASLIEHLEGTRCLLKSWSASEVLQDAGLYHAAYGTDSFDTNLFDLSKRKDVADIVGVEAETIIYHYCACDRTPFFAQFGQTDEPIFYDRYSSTSYNVKPHLLAELCELTAANEVDIAMLNAEFIQSYGEGLADLFLRMQPFLSAAAMRKVKQVFQIGGSS